MSDCLLLRKRDIITAGLLVLVEEDDDDYDDGGGGGKGKGTSVADPSEARLGPGSLGLMSARVPAVCSLRRIAAADERPCLLQQECERAHPCRAMEWIWHDR